MAGQDSTRGRAPRLTFGEGLLTRALELIASKPHWQKALFPRHERASRWQIAQDVCVEVCIQEGCQEWIKDKVQRGLIAKDARGRFQSTKQWGYNPLDVKLRELREEHDRCYEDLVMDETWQSWEDVPYEKRAKLRSRYPHHFTVHDFLYDTRASRGSLTPSTAGPSRPSATPQFEPTPTPAPRSKTPRTTPAPSALPKRPPSTGASITPQTIKREIIEIEDSPPRQTTMPARATPFKRERSTGSDSSSDDTETSSSDDSYDDPEPPHFQPATEPRKALSEDSLSSQSRSTVSHSVTAKGENTSTAVIAPAATSSRHKRHRNDNGVNQYGIIGVSMVKDWDGMVSSHNGHQDGMSVDEGEVDSEEAAPISTSGSHEGAPSGTASDAFPDKLFFAALSGEKQLILDCLTPGEKEVYHRTRSKLRGGLIAAYRLRLSVKVVDFILKSKSGRIEVIKDVDFAHDSDPPLRLWPDHAFYMEDHQHRKSTNATAFARLIEVQRRFGAAASPSFDALLAWRCTSRIIVTAHATHSELGEFQSRGYRLERITAWEFMRRCKERYESFVLQSTGAESRASKRIRK